MQDVYIELGERQIGIKRKKCQDCKRGSQQWNGYYLCKNKLTQSTCGKYEKRQDLLILDAERVFK